MTDLASAALGNILGLAGGASLPTLGLTGGAGGASGPAVSGNSSPVSNIFGPLVVGGTGNVVSTPQTATATSTPSTSLPNYFGTGTSAAGGSSTSLLLYGGIACIALYMLVKR